MQRQRRDPASQPATRRMIVPPNTPIGCVYYLLLITWCIAAATRHGFVRNSPNWTTASGVMFAVGVGLVATGLSRFWWAPRDKLQGSWITIAGSLAIWAAIWGTW